MTDNEHHQKLIEQIDEIENHRNLFQKKFIQHKQNLEEHSLIKQINQWEHDSIIKTKQTTEGCRQNFIHLIQFLNLRQI
ncbi:unnamed protein product [Adineta steineri]|uniref:Uncharacterized protein n=1 Tax=Adineta steineri TaxID=433720 RepID=A0A820NFJ0_9BILA|nr:unnamed protein product [Adineta steineri]